MWVENQSDIKGVGVSPVPPTPHSLSCSSQCFAICYPDTSVYQHTVFSSPSFAQNEAPVACFILFMSLHVPWRAFHVGVSGDVVLAIRGAPTCPLSQRGQGAPVLWTQTRQTAMLGDRFKSCTFYVLDYKIMELVFHV